MEVRTTKHFVQVPENLSIIAVKEMCLTGYRKRFAGIDLAIIPKNTPSLPLYEDGLRSIRFGKVTALTIQ